MAALYAYKRRKIIFITISGADPERKESLFMQTVTFLHCADVHIGAAAGFLGEKAAGRRAETLMTFERIMKLAADRRVDFVLIAGDLFDSNRVEEALADAVFGAIKASAVPVVAVAGNHDPLSADSPFRRNAPDNLCVLGEEDCSVEIPGLPVRIFGRSFTGPYLAGEERFPLPPAPGKYNLLLLHGDLNGSQNYNPITSGFIEKCGMDYLALGHIHAASGALKSGKTVFAYPGCPEGQGFDETGEKGVYIGTLNEQGCSLEFVPVCKRRFETVKVDVSDCETQAQLLPAVSGELKERFGEEYRNNLYKIILTGALPEDFSVNTAELSERLSAEVYFAKVRDKTTVRADLSAIAQNNDLMGIFTRKMLERAAEADADGRRRIMAALDIGLRAFNSEVNYREDN